MPRKGSTSLKDSGTLPWRSVTPLLPRVKLLPRHRAKEAPVVLQGAAPNESCRFCGVKGPVTEVAIGPMFTKICDKCSEPLWNGMRAVDGAVKFYEWFKKVTK